MDTEKPQIIETILNIYNVSKENKTSMLKENDEKIKADIATLNNYFKTTSLETMFLIAFIVRYLENGIQTNIEGIASFFGTNPIDILLYKEAIISLYEKNYIFNPNERKKQKIFTANSLNNIQIRPEIIDCILNDTEFKPPEEEIEEEHNALQFVCLIKSIATNHDNDIFEGYNEFCEKLKNCENDFSDIEFVQESRRSIPSTSLRYLFYDVCGEYVGSGSSNLNSELELFFPFSSKFTQARSFMEESNVLFSTELIAFTQKSNLSDAKIEPTLKAQKMYIGDNIDLFQKKSDNINFIQPKSIKKKELFYSPENEIEINRIAKSISKGNFKKIQNRLDREKLPTGITILLHGDAGTGKTETAYQLAKKTGRAIFHVDIAASKSSWFGESEKIIKKLFDDYNSMRNLSLRQNKPCPIMLFNEADSIFKKRSENTEQSTDQTLNTMQNIILEEMEKFQGILIATTNLASNFDYAFERRFLFKVKFERPSIEAKKSIWLSKLKWLDENGASKFAREFDFSGGEIDNICRKITMEEIITGRRPSLENIMTFCQNEKLEKQKSASIGFTI